MKLFWVSVLLVVGVGVGPASASATEAPIAAYSFDEGEGGIAHDSVNSHDGSVKGAFWVKGKYGPALKFHSNKADILTIPSSLDLELTEAFTLEAWVRPQGTEFSPVISKEAPGEWFSYQLAVGRVGEEEEARNAAFGLIQPSELPEEYVEGSKGLPDNGWSHLALTFDGESMRAYVDGVLDGFSSSSPPQGGEGPLFIGGARFFNSYFQGRIDEVRIYDRALGVEEINEDLETPIGTTEGSEEPEEWVEPETCDGPVIQVDGVVTQRGVPGVSLGVEVEQGDEPCKDEETEEESEVESLDIYVDAELVFSEGRDCSEGACASDSLTRRVQLPYEETIGTRHFLIRAEDQFGNEAEPVEWTEVTSAEGTVSSVPPEAEDSKESEACATPKNRYNRYVFRNGVVYGTPCADILGRYVKQNIKTYRAGPGDDVVRAGGEVNTIRGGDGDDRIYAGRGNDTVYGGSGHDQIVAGSGDDLAEGNAGNDLLVGSAGADKIFGNQDNDVVRGGTTTDKLTGGPGTNTLSFVDSVSPGFEFGSFLSGFPVSSSGRGVYIDLGEEAVEEGPADQYIRAFNGNTSRYGGGADRVSISDGTFQNVIGSPFADVIEGSSEANVIDGGGGPDIIKGRGGNDEMYGGADSDLIDGGEGQSAGNLRGGDGDDICLNGTESALSCERESTEEGLKPATSEEIAVGLLNPDNVAAGTGIYLRGSVGGDNITATWDGANKKEEENVVRLTAQGKSGTGRFDIALNGVSGCTVEKDKATCPLGAVQMITIDGGDGNDVLKAHGFPAAIPVTLLGGSGKDSLRGGPSEDMLVDGPGEGNDNLFGLGGDDTFFANEGRDRLYGAAGSDLFVSSSACEDLIHGGGDRDNASWAQLRGEAKGETGEFHDPVNGAEVSLPIGEEVWGEIKRVGGGCGNSGEIRDVEFLEGSGGKDHLEGDEAHNIVLGRSGEDTLIGLGGDDNILANNRDPSGESKAKKEDPDKDLDCGDGWDTLRFDKPYDTPAIDESCDQPRPGPATQSSVISGIGSESTAEAPVASIDEDVIAGANNPETIPPNAFFRLDEASGEVAENAMDGEASGSYEEGVSLDEPGALEESRGVQLDGEDDHLDLTSSWDPADYRLIYCGGVTNGYTVEMWVKFDDEAASREELFSRAEGANGISLYRSTNQRLNFSVGTAAGSPTVSSEGPVSAEEWHHVVATVSEETPGCPTLLASFGTPAISELTLHIDGFARSLGLGSETPFPEATPLAQNIVGARDGEGGLSNWLNATVDDVAIYGHPLDETDAQTHLAVSNAENAPVMLLPEIDSEDGDTDEDGVRNSADNCEETPNANQDDTDGDGTGDACQVDADSDEDEVSDVTDNCPEVANKEQEDTDENGVGDACEPE